jgi:selenocysteine-specific elongation factor
VKRSGIYGIKLSLIEGWIQAEIPSIRKSVGDLKDKGIVRQFEDILIHTTAFESFRETTKKILHDYHKKNPLKPGMLKEELKAHFTLEPRLFGTMLNALKEIALEKELVRLAAFQVALSQGDETGKTKILELLEKGGVQPPMKEELLQSLKMDQKHFADIMKLMSKEGSIVRINDSMYIASSVYSMMIGKLKEFYTKKPEMTVAEFRDILNTTRKYALPLLEYLDSNKVTLRVGDVRKFLLK